MSDVIQARSDVDKFPALGEAIDEATLRADGDDVWIHKADYRGTHFDSESCGCEPIRISSVNALTKGGQHENPVSN